MIKRPLYLDKITPFIGRDVIKVLVGIRRAGKSSLLEQVEEMLKAQGVPAEEIVHINFDTLDYAGVRTREGFLELVRKLYKQEGKRRFLFDEVQLVEGWDEVVSALYAEKETDLYLTGSNSKLLSSELSTFLTGRYINIRVSTLNFNEYLDFKRARGEEIQGVAEEFQDYLYLGGFPVVHTFAKLSQDSQSGQTLSQTDDLVSDIYSSIVLRDIVERKKVRNTELLTRVVKFAFDNIGNPFSASSVSAFLKNEKRNLDPETVYNYLSWLTEAFVLDRAARYDVRGKAVLKTQEKYYLGDVSLLYAVNGRGSLDSLLPGLLENVVYHELLSRGYAVYIGKNGEKEIDFVAEKDHQKMYLQVATTLRDKKTADREFGAFEGISDNYPKYVLTMDPQPVLDREGVVQRYLPEFLGEL